MRRRAAVRDGGEQRIALRSALPQVTHSLLAPFPGSQIPPRGLDSPPHEYGAGH
jgi:hypothetical protein